MVEYGTTICPYCRGGLKHYDRVDRIVRTKGGVVKRIKIRRLRCLVCKKLHREIPNDICPYKQYEADIIDGVMDGCITSNTLGFEDYPCEMTIKRWLTRNKQASL